MFLDIGENINSEHLSALRSRYQFVLLARHVNRSNPPVAHAAPGLRQFLAARRRDLVYQQFAFLRACEGQHLLTAKLWLLIRNEQRVEIYQRQTCREIEQRHSLH